MSSSNTDFLNGNVPLPYLDHRYISLGIQYFILGRNGCLLIFNPTCGNLYHLAFEMLIKAYLNLTYSKNELYKKYRHNLPKLWEEFKFKTGEKGLKRLDYIINDLHVWENLRYLEFPNKSGAYGIETSFGHSPKREEDSSQQVNRKNNIYRIYLDDMDEVFRSIILAMHIDINHIINHFDFQHGLEIYTKDNKYSLLEENITSNNQL